MTDKTNRYTKSQNKIRQAGKELFWKHGISRISVEELCESAGVSKMTFYRNYTNKYELAKQLIKELSEEGLNNYRKIMAQDIAFPLKVRLMQEAKKNQTKDFSMELIRDIFSNPDPASEILLYLEEIKKTHMEEIKNDFQEAQNHGWIRKELKIDFIIHMMNSIQRYVEDPILLDMFDSVEELSEHLTDYFFHAIISDKKE